MRNQRRTDKNKSEEYTQGRREEKVPLQGLTGGQSRTKRVVLGMVSRIITNGRAWAITCYGYE